MRLQIRADTRDGVASFRQYRMERVPHMHHAGPAFERDFHTRRFGARFHRLGIAVQRFFGAHLNQQRRQPPEIGEGG